MGASASSQKQITKNSSSCIRNRKSQTAPKLRSGRQQKVINAQTNVLNSYYSTTGIKKNSASAQQLRTKILNLNQKAQNAGKQSKIHQYLVSSQYRAPNPNPIGQSNSNFNSQRVQQLPVVQQLSQYTNSGISKFSLTRSFGFSNDSAKLMHKSQEQRQSIKPHDKSKKLEQKNIIREQEQQQNKSVKLDKPDKNFSQKVSSVQYKRAQPEKPYYIQKQVNHTYNPYHNTYSRNVGLQYMHENAYGENVNVDNNRYNAMNTINNIVSNNYTDINKKINITTSNTLNNTQPTENAIKYPNISKQLQKQSRPVIPNEYNMGTSKNNIINQQYNIEQDQGVVNNSSISNISDMINSNISPTPIGSDQQIKYKDNQFTHCHYLDQDKQKYRKRDIRKYQQTSQYQIYDKRQVQNKRFRYAGGSRIRQNQQKQQEKVVVLKNQNNLRQSRSPQQQFQYRTRIRKFKKVQNEHQSFNQCLTPQKVLLRSKNEPIHNINDPNNNKQILSSRRMNRSSNKQSICDNRESRSTNFRDNFKDNTRDNFKMYYNFDNYISDSRINSERQIGKIFRNNHKSRQSQRQNTSNDASSGNNSINLSQHKLGSKVILNSELSSQNTITDFKSTSKLIYF